MRKVVFFIAMMLVGAVNEYSGSPDFVTQKIRIL